MSCIICRNSTEGATKNMCIECKLNDNINCLKTSCDTCKKVFHQHCLKRWSKFWGNVCPGSSHEFSVAEVKS